MNYTRIWKKWHLFIVAFPLYAAIQSCNSSTQNPKEIAYYRDVCSNADSICSFYAENHTHIPAYFMSKVQQRFFFGGQAQKAQKTLQFVEGFLKTNHNNDIHSYHTLNKAYQYLWTNKLDSCLWLCQELKALPIVEDTSFLLSKSHIFGSVYFLKNNLDSANYFFQNGYVDAIKFKRRDYIQTFSINMGAIAYSKNLVNTAIYHFKNAIEQIKPSEKPNNMLNNNLAAALISQGKYSDAQKILKLDTANLNLQRLDYYGVITKLNMVSLQQFMGNWSEARKYLNVCQETAIPSAAYPSWLQLNLKQLHRENRQKAAEFFLAHKTDFLDNVDHILNTASDVLATQSTEFPNTYMAFELDTLFTPRFISTLNLKSQYTFWKIKSNLASSNGLLNQSLAYGKLSSASLLKYCRYLDSIKIHDVAANLKLIQTTNQLKESEQNLLIKQQQLDESKLVTFLLVALVIVLGFLGFFITKNKSQKHQMMSILLESKTKEAQFLEEEKNLNSKLNQISKTIIDKSKMMAETIKHGPYSNVPEIKLIQSELEKLSHVDNLTKSPSRTQHLQQEYQYLWQQYPIFNALNDTQQRILILSIEQLKPKEIAIVLNLSYPYVRNVQSMLRKQLTQINVGEFLQLKKSSPL